jgi:hypothetical protein
MSLSPSLDLASTTLFKDTFLLEENALQIPVGISSYFHSLVFILFSNFKVITGIGRQMDGDS